jgi:hypothetical protein
MRASEIKFVEEHGIGRGFSEKIRQILRNAQNTVGILCEYDEAGDVVTHIPTASCLFTITPSGERIWADELPFPYEKKSGYKGLAEAARKAGLIVQEVSMPDNGLVAIWVSPRSEGKTCAQCRARIREFVNKEMKD